MCLCKENIELNSYFCPNCHFATLKDSSTLLLYKKCQSCGFMETKEQTKKRVQDKLKLIYGDKCTCNKAK